MAKESPLSAASGNAAGFLVEILQLIGRTQGDSTQVYAFFQANVGRLDATLLKILPDIFSNLIQQNDPKKIASLFSQFGNLIQQFPLGNRMLNLEMAIVAYQKALTVRTLSEMSIEWAETTNNLAVAYYGRIQGDRAKNIELAINAYTQALTVTTKASMPIEWAETTMNLGNAYKDRIQGDRAENIEKAIIYYQQALTIRTKASMPIEWAGNTMNLATAYYFRIQGNRAENIELAITAYNQALTVITEITMPIEWVATVNNLAVAYSDRIQGDRVENIEKSIIYYQQVLTRITKFSMPIEWAESTMNLATAHVERIHGDRAENIEKSIIYYQQALTVRTKAYMPIEWAATINNLGNAYIERVQGDRDNNIERAIDAFQQALTVTTKATMPIEWAQTTNNLANAYYSYFKDNRANNIEMAITYYQQSLTVRTQADMPIEWASTNNNLAIAYSERIKGDHAKNIERAIDACRSSLEIFTPTTLPDNCRGTGGILANLYSSQNHWTEAVRTYHTALQAAEICYQRSDFLDSKSSELNTTDDLSRCAAYAYAKTGDLPKAIVTLEQGRARGLSESLSRDRANLTQLEQINPNLYREYKKITTQLRDLEIQQRNSDRSLTRLEIQTLSQNLDQQLQKTIEKIRQVPSYEDFLTPTKWEDIALTLTSDNPLVYIVTTPNGSLALISTDNTIDLLPLNQLNEKALREIVYGPDQKKLGRYLGAYHDARKDFKTNSEAWYEEIESTTRQLWDLLMEDLIERLKGMGFDRAILIPTGLLSLLPLHAAWTADIDLERYPTGKRYALDDIHFTYTPNALSLTAARKIEQEVNVDSILAIDNPRQDLPNSEREINCVIDTFRDRHTILRHDEATIEAVKAKLTEATIVHFSCHGTADFDQPLNSGLFMSNGVLTLKDLLALKLANNHQGIRLAILSACETGLPGLDNIDEVVSLPIGLLQAGVAGIVASLWSVDEFSTILLLIKFYDTWRNQKQDASEALRQAQRWLRDTTNQEKSRYFEQQAGQTIPQEIAEYLAVRMDLEIPDTTTFVRPYHWAAFAYIGV